MMKRGKARVLSVKEHPKSMAQYEADECHWRVVTMIFIASPLFKIYQNLVRFVLLINDAGLQDRFKTDRKNHIIKICRIH